MVDGGLVPACTLARDGGSAEAVDCTMGGFGWELGPGAFVFAASASDAAGNGPVVEAVSFSVAATYPSMVNLTRQWVTKPGVAKDLVGLLNGAATAEARNQLQDEASKLAQYRALLAAQSGKGVPPDKAVLLSMFSMGL